MKRDKTKDANKISKPRREVNELKKQKRRREALILNAFGRLFYSHKIHLFLYTLLFSLLFICLFLLFSLSPCLPACIFEEKKKVQVKIHHETFYTMN